MKDRSFLKCSNTSCYFFNNYMPWPADKALILCPICHSAMEIADTVGENDGFETDLQGSDHSGWLAAIASDEKNWSNNVEEKYPAVIAYEYRKLREYCRKEEPYAVLLMLKDNFEALLKFEVLLAYSWAAEHKDETFKASTVSQLMTKNLSMGSWLELASVIEKKLNAAGEQLPDVIPLSDLRKWYLKNEIVNWRNTNIGHGVMALEEDEDFRKDIYEKIILLKDLYESLDKQLKGQEIYMPGEDSATELLLTGADYARGLKRIGKIYFRTKDNKLNFCIDPFVVIRKHENNGYGIYFFDNQRTTNLTYFLAYAEGTKHNENIGYFMYLSKQLATSGIRLESMADDMYLTEDEIKELDVLQMSHEFVRPEHLVDWLKACLKKYDRGIFWLQMDRGTGKSVFADKLNSLTPKCLQLSDDLDVRTYHFARSQSAGTDDIRNAIERMWEKDYDKKIWERAPRISDFEKEGIDRGEALCAYLKEVQKYCKRNREKDKILMVLDGLDEISEEDLWDYIPKEKALSEGIYFLLTSRNPEIEDLPAKAVEHLNGLNVKEKYYPLKEGKENVQFLNEYIKKTRLSNLNLTQEDKERILLCSDHRVLMLGMLCRLVESGMPIEDIPCDNKVVSLYLGILKQKYGEKESIKVRELLSILCTLGTYEGLSLASLGALLSDNGITLRLIGMLRDLAPMLKNERDEDGTRFMIANPGLASELEKQIPETEYMVRLIVNLTMSILLEDTLENEKALEVAAAHFVELALDKLPKGIDVLGEAGWDALLNLHHYACNRKSTYYEKKRFADYTKQIYLYFQKFLGDMHYNTLSAEHDFAVALGNLGHFKSALALFKEVYEKRIKLLEMDSLNEDISGQLLVEILNSEYMMGQMLHQLGKYEEALGVYKNNYEKSREILGENHQYTLEVWKKYKRLAQKYISDEEKLQIYQMIFTRKKETQGKYHPETVWAGFDLACTHERLGNYEEALELYKFVYEYYKRMFTDNSIMANIVLFKIAVMLEKLGRNVEAQGIKQELKEKNIVPTKEIIKRPDKNENFDDIDQIGNEADLFNYVERYQDALRLYEIAYEKSKRSYGEKHPNTLMLKCGMAASLKGLGRKEEALLMYQEAYDVGSKELGKEHPNMLIIKQKIEGIIDGSGNYESVDKDYKKQKFTQSNNYKKNILKGEMNKMTGYGKRTYEDGTVYEGEYVNGLRNGKGRIEYPNGDVQEGEWKDDKPNGYGKATFSKGTIYEGEFKNWKRNGHGKMIFSSGDIYEGEWKDDLKNGHGIITYSDGFVYEGEFINDMPVPLGTAVLKFPNGKKYEGECKNGVPSGKGTMIYPNGMIYEGEFIDGKREGSCTIKLPNGRVFEGNNVDGKPNGYGVLIISNREKYEGYWQDGKKSGQGKYVYPEGSVYEGEFTNDARNGKGKMLYSDGRVYNGEWKDNLFDGVGTLTLPDGRKYEGEWKNDLPNGLGKMTLPNGKKYEGTWKDGDFVK